MRHSSSSRLAVLVFGAVATATGCLPQQNCTLIGCSSSLNVDVPWLGTAPSFDVTVDGPGVAGAFTCTLDPDNAGAYILDPSTATGDFAPDSGSPFSAECDGTRSTFRIATGAEGIMPSELALTVSAAGDTRSQNFSGLQYDVLQPNGEDCAPTCENTGLTVE